MSLDDFPFDLFLFTIDFNKVDTNKFQGLDLSLTEIPARYGKRWDLFVRINLEAFYAIFFPEQPDLQLALR